MTAKGQLFIVSAPSGAGKTSLIKALLEALPDIMVSVSYTTRKQRSGETSGVDYHFSDQNEFQTMVNQDDFLEHATVFGHSYGTSRAHVDQKLLQGIDAILEIDWQGAQQVRKAMNDSCSIFILPPSKQVLEDRLKRRGQDSEEIIAKRMRTAVDEMSHYDEYDFLVVNDNFDMTLTELIAVIKSQRLAMRRGKLVNATLIEQLVN